VPAPAGESVTVSRILGRFFAVLALVAVSSAPAFADATGDLKNAAANFMKLTSYHIDVAGSHGPVAQADVVPPSRVHAIVPHAETILVDSTLYIKVHGSWHQFQMHGPSKLFDQPNYSKMVLDHVRDVDAKDLGMRTVDGASLHAYSVTNPKSHKTDTVFLDNGGRITRVEGRGAVITISKFNTPMTIAAPI
jgi:hypothetical protein